MTNSPKPARHALRLALIAVLVAGGWASAAVGQVSFSEDVFPILELRCLSCHQPGGEGYEKSGLDMRTYESLMAGSEHGPMIIPGDIIESNLLAMIDRRTSPELWMPHEQKQLSKCERQAIRFWVAQGAKND